MPLIKLPRGLSSAGPVDGASEMKEEPPTSVAGASSKSELDLEVRACVTWLAESFQLNETSNYNLP